MSEDNILLFIPKHQQNYSANIEDFVCTVKSAENPNDKMDYATQYWPEVGNFTKMGISSKNRDVKNQLDESILPFAKAYIKYQAIKSGTSMYAHFYAIRALESACIKAYGEVDIVSLLPCDFDSAAQDAKNSLGEGATYQAGSKLNTLRKFLVENKLIKPFDWKNPFSKPKDKKDLTGEEGQKYREDKMPDENAIMAIAEIFSKPTCSLSDRDIFTSSTFSLLMSAPERGSEPLFLRYDCLDIRTVKPQALSKDKPPETLKRVDGVEVLLHEKKDEKDDVVNEEQVGIKWYSGKGYGFENKSIPSVMNPVVKEAIHRLEESSREARSFAKLLEDTNDFPRHPLCPDVDEDELLTKIQVSKALGYECIGQDKTKANNGVNSFLKERGIERKDYVVTLRKLNKLVRSRLPSGWPYVPFKKGKGKVKLKWSEALYASFANQFDLGKATVKTELWMPNITTINEDLKPTKKKNRVTGEISKGTLSIFKRHGYQDIQLRTHQPRHLLDTIASVNGMSDTLRSKWAGRADPKHNRAYNHTTEEEYNHDWLEEQSSQEITDFENMKSAFKVQIASGSARSLQQFNTRTSLAMLLTDMGECKSSYYEHPCLKHRDCVNCNEHICVKGNKEHLQNLEGKYKREKLLLKGDKKALDEGVNGALQWYERRSITVQRLKTILEWLNNPDVKVGDRIKLADIVDVTHLDRALIANGKKALPKIENYQRMLSKNKKVTTVEILTFDELVPPTSEIPINKANDDEVVFNNVYLEDDE